MEFDPRPLRKALGVDKIREEVSLLIRIIRSFRTEWRMEMSTAKEQLDGLSAKVDDLVSDVRAAREALEANRANLDTDGQAALDTLTAKLDAFDAEVGDADGSDTPAEAPVDAPVDAGPVDGPVVDDTESDSVDASDDVAADSPRGYRNR